MLVAPANGDFHTQPASPAVDSGVTPASWTAFTGLFGTSIASDIEGKARPAGSGVDRGAYER